jgi:hypothetical protein
LAPSSDHHGGDDSSDRASDGAAQGRKSRKIGERSNGRNGSRDAECDECKPDHDVPRTLTRSNCLCSSLYGPGGIAAYRMGRTCRAVNRRDKFLLHSITSSARASRVDDRSMLSALAVLRLTINSILVLSRDHRFDMWNEGSIGALS